MTAATNSRPAFGGQAGSGFDVVPTTASKGEAQSGAEGGASSPAVSSSASLLNPLALVATFLDAALATELQHLRTSIATLAAEYESLRDPLLGAPLIDASRVVGALRGLLGEAGA